MTIEQTEIVDFIGTNESEEIVLTISDHLAWDDENEHLYLLQEKLNSYLAFIESGEIYESYPSSKGKNKVIDICYKFEPTSSVIEFLLLAKKTIQNTGVSLTWSKG